MFDKTKRYPLKLKDEEANVIQVKYVKRYLFKLKDMRY